MSEVVRQSHADHPQALEPPIQCSGEEFSVLKEWREKVVGDPGIEPGVRLREGVTVPCHTLRPVAHWRRE